MLKLPAMFDYYQTAPESHKKKERARARELRGTSWWRQKLAEGICYYCQQNFPKEELTMDHKVPVARGGRSTKGNVVVCCKTCNTDKRHLTPAEMLLNASDPQK
ncbi:MAG: HNH endonuclease [Bdellovibrionales bacterium]